MKDLIDKAEGFNRYFLWVHMTETIFYRDKILELGDKYRYGYYWEDSDVLVNSYYNRVLQLCMKPITRNPMGGDVFISNILGLTPDDLMKYDFASLVDLEARITQLENGYVEEMNQKKKAAKEDT